MSRPHPSAVVFDIGGVLIDWNPRYLYRLLIEDEAAMERFLAEVCTPEWNRTLDAGRSFAEAVETLTREHPDEADLIAAYHSRWPEMLGGAFEDSVSIVGELKARGVPVYALSNWAAETFAATRRQFPFLDDLDGLVISGEVGVGKPDAGIFRHLISRFGIEPSSTVFVDDWDLNVATAVGLGFIAIRFVDAPRLRSQLGVLGLLEEERPGASAAHAGESR